MSQNPDWKDKDACNACGSGAGRQRAVDPEILEPEPDFSQNGRQFRGQYFNGGKWTYVPTDTGGCLAASITCALFLICMAQYGLLAGIGFIVFHIIGSVMGTVHTARQLVRGIIVNPWSWRTGNWIISFLLTVWLAG